MTDRPHNGQSVASPGSVLRPTLTPQIGDRFGEMMGPYATGAPLSGDRIDLKLLVLGYAKSDPHFAAITDILAHIGVPFDALSADAEQITEERLWHGSRAHYQGVIMSTENLGYWNAEQSCWKRMLSDEDRGTLRYFQARFGIRQVTMFGISDDSNEFNGLRMTEPVDTYSAPLNLHLTDAGREIFWYLNEAVTVPIWSVAAYLAQADDPATIPLLTTANGDTLAALCRDRDGNENLVMTMGHGRGLLHTLLFGYGLVNWVTRGLFLGERRVYLNVQVDDILNRSHLWNADTQSGEAGEIFRLDSADANALVNWTEDLTSRRNAADLMLEFAFNGAGIQDTVDADALASVLISQQARFRWINHGFTHLLLHSAGVAESLSEIRLNHELARSLGFDHYCSNCMVTAETSGLNNPAFLAAASAAGIRYLVSDTSRPGEENPSPNVGIRSPHQPEILIIPRRPNNLFYSASTPGEWVGEYNHIYRDHWGRDLAIDEIVEHEAAAILRYMLEFDIDPLMFHQANLRAYDGTHSLLSDLIDKVMTQYNQYFGDVPAKSLNMRDIGQSMLMRAARINATVEATLIVGSGLALVSDRDVTVPITGARVEGADVAYAGQMVSSVTLKTDTIIRIPMHELIGFEPARHMHMK